MSLPTPSAPRPKDLRHRRSADDPGAVRALERVREAQRELDVAQQAAEEAMVRRNLAVTYAREAGVPAALLQASTSLPPAALELAVARGELLTTGGVRALS
ncbi:hypothetical protein V5H98_00195 [Georgenia sp. M64]|uniref:hypothetical protein n=1 Tax=Georgenia sp. M64 TaxID=3120520 RepID=UPI0030E07686